MGDKAYTKRLYLWREGEDTRKGLVKLLDLSNIYYDESDIVIGKCGYHINEVGAEIGRHPNLLWVHENYRGNENETILVKEAIEMIKGTTRRQQLGLERIEAYVGVSNCSAQGIFEELGFVNKGMHQVFCQYWYVLKL